MIDLGDNPFEPNDEEFVPELDNERKGKVLQIGRAMKDSTYMLSVAWQDEEWLVVCTAKIFDVIYQSANSLDKFSVHDHAELFRMAFSNALKEQEIARFKKTFIMPEGNA